MKKPLVIAIDGPAAAGKGTLAHGLAAHFHLPHLDTGLLYRAVARRLLDEGADPRDPNFAHAGRAAAEVLDEHDLARNDLRTPEVDRAASVVAGDTLVRQALLTFQRAFPAERGGVLDGRDIGTVVLPEATIKFFVTAAIDVRARRRLAELRARGIEATLDVLSRDIARRDEEDRTRSAAPLRQAKDALLIDTSALDADATLKRALALARARLGCSFDAFL